mmetsp:Transcript_90084/g.143404  ORF Transcript_90084/g.143404 Transcript_90084/m.143404 type:complete len:286 (+) Transcript_90084:81-938(+)
MSKILTPPSHIAFSSVAPGAFAGADLAAPSKYWKPPVRTFNKGSCSIRRGSVAMAVMAGSGEEAPRAEVRPSLARAVTGSCGREFTCTAGVRCTRAVIGKSSNIALIRHTVGFKSCRLFLRVSLLVPRRKELERLVRPRGMEESRDSLLVGTALVRALFAFATCSLWSSRTELLSDLLASRMTRKLEKESSGAVSVLSDGAFFTPSATPSAPSKSRSKCRGTLAIKPFGRKCCDQRGICSSRATSAVPPAAAVTSSSSSGAAKKVSVTFPVSGFSLFLLIHGSAT